MKTDKTFDVTEKARIYHTLAQMSSSFSSIIRYCDDLESAGILAPKIKRRFQAFTIEVQGELNLEVLNHMESIEMENWARGVESVRDGKNIFDLKIIAPSRSPTKHKSPVRQRELAPVRKNVVLPILPASTAGPPSTDPLELFQSCCIPVRVEQAFQACGKAAEKIGFSH